MSTDAERRLADAEFTIDRLWALVREHPESQVPMIPVSEIERILRGEW